MMPSWPNTFEGQQSLVCNGSIVHALNSSWRAGKKPKENPAKGRVSRLLFGRVALFPLREEALLTNESWLKNPAEQVPRYQLFD